MSQTSPHSLSPVSVGDQDPYLVRQKEENRSKITSNKENPLGSPRNVKQSSWKCAENLFTMIGEYDASDMCSKCPAGGFSP